MNFPSLDFNNVTVEYPVYNSQSMSLRTKLVKISTGGRIDNGTGNIKIVTALKNVSFKLNKGDSVGLIGHNGAGKSTLLRTMAGIYNPSIGNIKREGQIATVLELGAGMDIELSGYENIIRMGVLMGMSIKNIIAKTQDIKDFTQLGDFLHLPVRTYSAGMSTRLMFAVATSTQPDILLVDEVFGMGDEEFQIRAKERMETLIKTVGIFVFSSHNKELIKKYCNRIFQLQHGQLKEISFETFT